LLASHPSILDSDEFDQMPMQFQPKTQQVKQTLPSRTINFALPQHKACKITSVNL